MEEYKNDDFFYVGDDRDVTVTVTFSANPGCNKRAVLLNAAEAIKFYADNNEHKSWTRRINVTRNS